MQLTEFAHSRIHRFHSGQLEWYDKEAVLVLGDPINGGIESGSGLKGRCVAHVPDVATRPWGACCHDNNLLRLLQAHSHNLRGSKQLKSLHCRCLSEKVSIPMQKQNWLFRLRRGHKRNSDMFTDKYCLQWISIIGTLFGPHTSKTSTIV